MHAGTIVCHFPRLGGQGVGSTDQCPGTNPATLTTAPQGGQDHETPVTKPRPGNQILTTPHEYNPGSHLQPWNAPGTCLPRPSKRSPPEWVGGDAKIDWSKTLQQRHNSNSSLTKMATTHQLLCVLTSEFLTAVPPFKKFSGSHLSSLLSDRS